MAGMKGPRDSSGCRARSSAQERQQWVEKFLQSGLSRREFARAHDLRFATLQRWVQRSSQSSQSRARRRPLFTEVKLPPAAAAPGWAAELLRPDGARLRLAPDISGALVRQLLRAW
jgi:transposase-like protein